MRMRRRSQGRERCSCDDGGPNKGLWRQSGTELGMSGVKCRGAG
jgi:hypothetical protein